MGHSGTVIEFSIIPSPVPCRPPAHQQHHPHHRHLFDETELPTDVQISYRKYTPRITLLIIIITGNYIPADKSDFYRYEPVPGLTRTIFLRITIYFRLFLDGHPTRSAFIGVESTAERGSTGGGDDCVIVFAHKVKNSLRTSRHSQQSALEVGYA